MRIARGKRGRPPKFGCRAQVVALTLPRDVVDGLRRIDGDLGWAVVRLYKREAGRARTPHVDRAIAELVRIADRHERHAR